MNGEDRSKFDSDIRRFMDSATKTLENIEPVVWRLDREVLVIKTKHAIYAAAVAFAVSLVTGIGASILTAVIIKYFGVK